MILSADNLVVNRSSDFELRVPKLRIKAGTIVCIAGPNGSGKSTLLNCLTGLLTPRRGTILINGVPVGKNARATKLLFGFVPDDEEWIIKELCAKEYFELLARIYREAGCGSEIENRIVQLATLLSFSAFQQQLGSLSHGNVKKVQLIAAFMHSPKLVILDEVRNGLDPLAILAVEQLLRQERSQGVCIVAATHDLWWAERLSDRVIFMSDGSVQIDQKTAMLVRKFGSLENLFIQKNGLKQ